MATSDPIIHNGEITPKAAHILGQLLAAWIVFKESHDLESEKIQCCEKTTALFRALTTYEKMMF